MVERSENSPVYTPEYWGGHWLGADCDKTALNHSDSDMLAQYKKGILLKKSVTNEVKLYMASDYAKPVSVFENGSTFDSNEFPHGTFLRINEARIEDRIDVDDLVYESYNHLGIIIKPEMKNLPAVNLVRYSPADGHLLTEWSVFDFGMSVLKIGESIHEYHTFNGARLSLPPIEFIRKVNSIEVLMIGKGERKLVKDRLTVLRNLLPHRLSS